MYGDHFEEFVRVKRVDPLFDENAECFAAFKASWSIIAPPFCFIEEYK